MHTQNTIVKVLKMILFDKCNLLVEAELFSEKVYVVRKACSKLSTLLGLEARTSANEDNKITSSSFFIQLQSRIGMMALYL